MPYSPVAVAVAGMDQKQTQLKPETQDDHECLPLKQRLKVLRSKSLSKSPDEIFISALSPIEAVVKKEDDLCESLGFHSDNNGSKGRSDIALCVQNQHGSVHATGSSPAQDGMLSERLETQDNDAQYGSVTQLANCQNPSSGDDIGISKDFLEDLDHVVLRERQRMLLSRELVGSIGPSIKHNISDPSANSIDVISQNVGIRSEEIDISSNGITGAPARKYQNQGTIVTGPRNYKKDCGEARPYFFGRSASNEKCSVSSPCKTVRMPPFLNVKVEPLDDELQIPDKDVPDSQCLGNQVPVKSEHVNTAEIFEDIIDHMMLGDRMRLLAPRKFSKSTLYEKFESSTTLVSSASDHMPTLAESSKPLIMKRQRKRRKTATDSIETALEEDAPGLFQVLIEKGVLVDEIKLYGETEGDEELDESLNEESFSELEDVIAKLFSQRQPFFKLGQIRCAKGEKTSYCLACLISLVEQARYLRVRKWPVEWGWCRDLQSFIFVFERHNRIVLERPEYGYATYFFELVDALPVHWQIKRLVTAMKLTSCSRITLLENRALMVGDDLTEGEARVLMEYGWIPDSGLGTMLNYCDRVVHDRKHESDSSEWRSKIGKLLTDGYNGGTIVPNDIPKKVTEYGLGDGSQIKLEQ